MACALSLSAHHFKTPAIILDLTADYRWLNVCLSYDEINDELP
jgi:hypothetical protein